ncbi:MAG TPA: hypothetical protein VJ729_05185 [Nitrososphaeraceae archaeon]|nr:hypothetical protein [Nitrososphaeraceae archaeon]
MRNSNTNKRMLSITWQVSIELRFVTEALTLVVTIFIDACLSVLVIASYPIVIVAALVASC